MDRDVLGRKKTASSERERFKAISLETNRLPIELPEGGRRPEHRRSKTKNLPSKKRNVP